MAPGGSLFWPQAVVCFDPSRIVGFGAYGFFGGHVGNDYCVVIHDIFAETSDSNAVITLECIPQCVSGKKPHNS